MKPWSLSEIAKIINSSTDLDGEICGISTDTRTISTGDLFIALSGDRFDGHTYVKTALEKGAEAAVVEHFIEGVEKDRCLLVEDCRETYFQLAKAYREKLSIPIIGITGSVGKTSVKEMVYAALSSVCIVHKTEENLNNELGVCQTILSIEESDQVAVVEMGIDHPGDMDILTKIVAPDVAIVTGVGISHLAQMGSRETLFQEKMKISDGMKKDAPIIINGDNDLLTTVSEWKGHPTLKYGLSDVHFAVYGSSIEEDPSNIRTTFSARINGREYEVTIPTLGKANVQNALAACAVLKVLDFPLSTGINGLNKYKSVGMRQKIVLADEIVVIEDCYNASPDSMVAALEVLEQIEPQNHRIAVLGDMLELGEEAPEYHEKMGTLAAEKQIDKAYFIGDLSKFGAKAAETSGVQEVYWFPDTDSAISAIVSGLSAGDVVLLKASRGMKFEKIATAIYDKYPKNGGEGKK